MNNPDTRLRYVSRPVVIGKEQDLRMLRFIEDAGKIIEASAAEPNELKISLAGIALSRVDAHPTDQQSPLMYLEYSTDGTGLISIADPSNFLTARYVLSKSGQYWDQYTPGQTDPVGAVLGNELLGNIARLLPESPNPQDLMPGNDGLSVARTLAQYLSKHARSKTTRKLFVADDIRLDSSGNIMPGAKIGLEIKQEPDLRSTTLAVSADYDIGSPLLDINEVDDDTDKKKSEVIVSKSYGYSVKTAPRKAPKTGASLSFSTTDDRVPMVVLERFLSTDAARNDAVESMVGGAEELLAQNNRYLNHRILG